MLSLLFKNICNKEDYPSVHTSSRAETLKFLNQIDHKASALKDFATFCENIFIYGKSVFSIKHFISPIYVRGSDLDSFGLSYSEL